MRTKTLILLSAAAYAAALAAEPARALLSEERYLDHVKYLSSAKLKGRGTGTKGLDQAAAYLANEFQKAGLQTVDGSYFQRFPVTTHAHLGRNNRLTLRAGEARTAVAFEKEFVPLNFSAAGDVSGEVVFAGYGITAPEYNYDDYAGIDVKGKIVVLFRREPQETDDKSPFGGRVYTRHAQFDSKAINAKLHGAKAAIVLTDVLGASSGELERFAANAGPANAGIPFAMMKLEAAEAFFAKSGKNLRELHKEIDQDLKPRSFALAESFHVEVRTDIRREVRQVRNVVGFLPGETDEYIVIGAHYDHLGLGEQFSMAPNMAGKPHLGADDNASGTAGVVELARWFAANGKPRRGVLFQCYAGEELGLLGSAYYVNHPLLPIEKAVAMINMDMIGRVKDGRVFIGGSGTGSSFAALLREVPAPAGLNFDLSETAGYGSSDHTSFTTKQVPVLFFFSGLHGDYHKPSDTWDKINAPQAVQLLSYVGNVAAKLTNGGERPQYVRVLPPAPSAHGTPVAGSHSGTASGGSGGYGPYFGSIPDFAEPPTGVRFADVREGSPAALAGLKAGDIMVGFAGKKIQNLYDFTYALRQSKPGDDVEVEVLRGGETVKAMVHLVARK